LKRFDKKNLNNEIRCTSCLHVFVSSALYWMKENKQKRNAEVFYQGGKNYQS